MQPLGCFNETNPRKSKTHSTGGITGLFHNPPTKATKDHFCIFPLASRRHLQIALNGHPSDFHFHSRSLKNGTESDNLVHIITFFSLWWCHSEHFGPAALWWQVAPALLRLGWALNVPALGAGSTDATREEEGPPALEPAPIIIIIIIIIITSASSSSSSSHYQKAN